MKVALALLLLASAVAAQEIDGKKIEKWNYIAWGKDDLIRMYFAPETIRRNGVRVTGWTRFDFPSGSESVLPNTRFSSLRIFVLFDCAQNRAQSQRILFYNPQGQFIKSESDSEWTPEKPGTLSYVAFEYLCERRTSFPIGPPVLKPKS